MNPQWFQMKKLSFHSKNQQTDHLIVFAASFVVRSDEDKTIEKEISAKRKQNCNTNAGRKSKQTNNGKNQAKKHQSL